MRKTDFAYAAGIVDGEGCIEIVKFKHPPRKNPQYRLRVQVVSTDMWLCQWLHFGFGGSVRERTKIPCQQKKQWYWIIQDSNGAAFLKLILPYLRIKQPQAELGVRFQSHKLQKRTKYLTDGELALREAERILMQSMKVSNQVHGYQANCMSSRVA